MRRIYSNGAADFVRTIFDAKLAAATSAWLAAPYFTDGNRVRTAALGGKHVRLIVGLNAATNPYELEKLRNLPGLWVRYLTSRFHAKIYIFDDHALLGSANLTDGGLTANREAVICLDRNEDEEAIAEVRSLFLDLWDSASVLTDEKLEAFKRSWQPFHGKAQAADAAIEKAVGAAHPKNVNVASRVISRERLFLEGLRKLVYEQYRPAFQEVEAVLVAGSYHRPELAGAGQANETNRFLNWLRLSEVHGEDTWRRAPLRGPQARRALVDEAGRRWAEAADPRVPSDYLDWLERVQHVFGSPERLASASQDALTEALMSLHAFTEQYRFTSGGTKNLPAAFWARNANDVERVRHSLGHLLYGPGDFAERLHDILYDPAYKIGLFARFCALELFGTVHPVVFPPINGRMARTLRYIGFDVPGD